MESLPFSINRQSEFYYSNYLYLPEVQDELIENEDIHLPLSKLRPLSEEKIEEYILAREYTREDLKYSLYEAAKSNSPYLVKYLLELGVDDDKHGAMVAAIELNNNDIINLLLESGYIWSPSDFYPLVKYNRVDIIRQLITRYRMEGNLTIVAAERGHYEMLKLLVENGMPISKFALEKAAVNGHFEIVKYLVNNNAPYTDRLITNTCEAGNFEIAKYLLDRGYPADSRCMGIIAQDEELFYYFLDKGVPVDEVSIIEAARYNPGSIKFLAELEIDGKLIEVHPEVIEILSSDNNLEMVKYLMEKSKEPNNNVIIDGGAVYNAAEYGNMEIVKYLIENGAPLDWAAVITAAANEDKELVRYLINLDIEMESEIDWLGNIVSGINY